MYSLSPCHIVRSLDDIYLLKKVYMIFVLLKVEGLI